MCGIVGIVGKSNVNQALYDALTVLQHRGQDAADQALHVALLEDVADQAVVLAQVQLIVMAGDDTGSV
uniref:hypothetical protein n=1 Tax=Pseudomonas aeruginosa TaxID=287 RepID=UPI0005BAB298